MPMPADLIQESIRLLLRSSLPHEEKMRRLEAMEPAIEAAWARGLTSAKPVSAITADDLDFGDDPASPPEPPGSHPLGDDPCAN